MYSPERSYAAPHSQLAQEDARYWQQSRSLSEEIMRLHELLDRARLSQNEQLRDLRTQCAAEETSLLNNYDQSMRELHLGLTSVQRRPADHSDLLFQLSKSREEHSQLLLELQHLKTQQEMTLSQSEALARNELRPLEMSIGQSVREMDVQILEQGRRNEWERQELERKATGLDFTIEQLEREVELMRESIKRHQERSDIEKEGLNQRISVYQTEIDRIKASQSEIEHEKAVLEHEGQEHSAKCHTVETQLARVMEVHNKLKPTAKKYENLVYGRGLSPTKQTTKTPKKSTKSPLKLSMKRSTSKKTQLRKKSKVF